MSIMPAIPERLCGRGGCVFIAGHTHQHSWESAPPIAMNLTVTPDPDLNSHIPDRRPR